MLVLVRGTLLRCTFVTDHLPKGGYSPGDEEAAAPEFQAAQGFFRRPAGELLASTWNGDRRKQWTSKEPWRCINDVAIRAIQPSGRLPATGSADNVPAADNTFASQTTPPARARSPADSPAACAAKKHQDWGLEAAEGEIKREEGPHHVRNMPGEKEALSRL